MNWDEDALARALGGLAGRYLPTERYTLEISLRVAPETVLGAVYSWVCHFGRVVDSDEVPEPSLPSVCGLVGSGTLRLNPALVSAEIVRNDAGVCTIRLTGAAKEGLIKQRSAEKVVRRVAQMLKTLSE